MVNPAAWMDAFQLCYADPPGLSRVPCPHCGRPQLQLLFVVRDQAAESGTAVFWCGNCLFGLMPNRSQVPRHGRRVLAGTELVPDYSIVVDESPPDDAVNDPDDDEATRLVGRYRMLAEEWDEQQSDAERANRLFDRHHEVAKRLRGIETGRRGIQALLTSPRTGVRLLAATDCLAWDPDVAIPVLEKIEAGPGLHAVTAKYTLKSYRGGELDLNW